MKIKSAESPPAAFAKLRQVGSWRDLPLWEHQKRSVELIERFLRETMKEAVVIQLPTGTGKTGIMAVVANYRNAKSDVLIVGPWKQLARQIAKEVQEKFWTKIKARPQHAVREAAIFTPKTMRTKLGEAKGPQIFICTYQTLTAIMRRRVLANLLKGRIGLVLADEGHREPAPKWSVAVRALERPTVLFTATPYRNDFRTFRVADNYTVQLSYDEAVRDRYIREVKFHEPSFANDVGRFCELFAEFFRRKLPRLKPSAVKQPRAIVRCDSENSVMLVATELRRLLGADTVLAVHERLKGPRGPLDRADVPDSDKTEARVWVHQLKLIEGVDDPDFCCVAFFEPFGNDRALIQQIGRVVRNPKRLREQFAHVFADASFGLSRHWESYRDYDRKNPRPWRDVERYNQVVAQHVTKLYVGQQFRDIFNPQAADAYLDLRFHRSARLFRLKSNVDFAWFSARLDQALVERGCQVLNRAELEDNTVVLIYQDLQPSRHLLEKAFPEARLGYAVSRLLPPYLVHFDTSPMVPDFFADLAVPIETEALERIINRAEAKVTQVSLLNGDLGVLAARRRSLTVVSLADMPPALNDSMFAVSTVTAYRVMDVPAPVNTPKKRDGDVRTRWYVGFGNATVTQSGPRHFTYEDFVTWSDWLVELVRKRAGSPDGSLNRFARYVRAPAQPRAAHILFDTSEFESQFTALPGPAGEKKRDEHLSIDDRASPVTAGKFEIVANEQTIKGRLKWDGESFQIESENLARVYSQEGAVGRRRGDFVSRVNHEQAFRVITEDGLLYSHGRFARPRASLWGADCPDQSRISRIITPTEALNGTMGEKDGEAKRRDGYWDSDSVFSRIDEGQLFKAENFHPDVLVCEDLGKERADFIALSLAAPRRIVLIHAKYAHGRDDGPPPRLSATAFHVICAQVQKNLSFLVPDAPLVTGDRWDNDWNGGNDYVVPNRIRRAPKGYTGAKIAEEIHTLVRSTDTLKEVWIVSGAGLCATSLQVEEDKEKPKPEAMQLIYLLHGTWNLVSMWGAKLRVFCPVKPPA